MSLRPRLPELMLTLALAWGAALPLQAARATAPEPAETDEIVPLLRAEYADPGALNALDTPAAPTLAALWPHLTGVALSPAPPAPGRTALRSEMLPGRIGYWGGMGLAPKDGAALALELRDWNVSRLRGLVVDLRHCAPPPTAESFADAARLAGYFLPADRVLFSIQALQVPQKIYQTGPALPGLPLVPPPPLIVLVDRETSGAAETLAEVLRRQAGAVVVGRSTAGAAALFSVHKLKSGRILRVPVAPVLLPDGTRMLGLPVAPDIAVFVDDRVESEALAQIQLGSAAHGLVEAPARRRMNESSLVREENPEIEEILSEQYRQARRDEAAPLQDVTLMRAVDILKGIALFPHAPNEMPETEAAVQAASALR